MCTAPLFVARRRAAEEGFTLIEGSCFAASPAGTTNRADYESMRDEILGQLEAALPVDGVLLGLHGAMVAYGYDDVEGDIIERARAIVGKDCVIGVELDPHCHLTLKRVRASDIIVLYKEFPHTDVVERAEDVLDLVLATLRGKIKPVMSVYDCRQIQSYPTTLPLMRAFRRPHQGAGGQGRHPVGLHRALLSLCRRARDLQPRAGDRRRRQGQGRCAGDRARRGAGGHARQDHAAVPRHRGRRAPRPWPATLAPVVIAEPADNAGGGAPSDNTSILRAPDREQRRGRRRSARSGTRSPSGSASMPAWAPAFPLRFGGKIGPASGQPVDAR